MSMLGRAFAGFGAGVSQLAQRYMTEEDAANRAKLMAELQVQTSDRVARNAAKLDDERAPVMLQREVDRIKSTTAATGEAQRAAAVAAGNDSGYQGMLDMTALRDSERKAAGEVAASKVADPYRRQKAQEDAEAAAATQRKVAKETAADPDFLKAQTAIKLADPEVAARIKASAASAAASYASAANSSAHAEQAREQTAGLKMVNKLKAEADSILNDQAISDEERKKKLAVIDERLIAMGGKQRAARDPELDTVTTERTTDDGKGGTIKTTEKSVRRPGQKAAEEADPIKAAMDAAREAKAKAAEKAAPKRDGMLNLPPADAAQPPALGAIDQGIYADLVPLKQQYEQAKAQLQAAARSGDQQSIQRYTQAVNAAAAELRQQAESRLGNGAPRFLAGVL